MKKISRFSFSAFLIIFPLLLTAQEADTVKAAKSISAGFEVSGPVLHAFNSSVLNAEAHLSYRLNHKYYIVVEPGFTDYEFSRYNYDYNNRGFFTRIGADIGMLPPLASRINHFAGIGLRYGVSVFEQEVPFISVDSYWGKATTSIPANIAHAHFLEVQGSIKTEVFRNLLIGWAVKLRTLVYSSAKDEKKPIYIPGMGSTDATFTPAFSYYIIYRIPLGSSSSE